MNWIRLFALAAAAGLTLSACGDVSMEEFRELVEGARSCEADADCVLAGAGQCTCNSPVNRSRAAEIDEAAADVDCNGAQVECASHANIRCEASVCVSDF